MVDSVVHEKYIWVFMISNMDWMAQLHNRYCCCLSAPGFCMFSLCLFGFYFLPPPKNMPKDKLVRINCSYMCMCVHGAQ